MAAGIKENIYDKNAIEAHNEIVKYLHSTKEIPLRFFKIEVRTLRRAIYVDAGFRNAKDDFRQIGAIIFHADQNEDCALALLAY